MFTISTGDLPDVWTINSIIFNPLHGISLTFGGTAEWQSSVKTGVLRNDWKMNIEKKVQCAVLTSKSINLSQESLTKLIVQSRTYLHLISAEGKTSPPPLAWQAIATAPINMSRWLWCCDASFLHWTFGLVRCTWTFTVIIPYSHTAHSLPCLIMSMLHCQGVHVLKCQTPKKERQR